jgi:hypothetical protein
MINVFKVFALAIAMLLASCGETVEPGETSLENPHEVTLTRHQVRRQRYNCEGVLYSDRIETSGQVSKILRINPSDTDKLWSFRAYNTRTNDYAGSLHRRYGKFTIDMAPTVFNMQVRPGINKITYKFTYCFERITQYDEEGNPHFACKHEPQIRENGELYIQVRYRETMADEIEVIKPSHEDCVRESL